MTDKLSEIAFSNLKKNMPAMIRKLLFTLILLTSITSLRVVAQQGDPWIIQSYKELYNRHPTQSELNIRNYNNGSWSSYTELKQYVSNYISSKAGLLKGDPWIFQVYSELYRRSPNALELNIKNYNGGTWGNYEELKKFVMDFQNSLRQSGITMSTAIVKDIAIVGLYQHGKQIAVSAVSTTAGQIIAPSGAAIVAGGAGNIISGGAGNIISGGAGNILSNDGASIAVNASMGGISFGSSYTLASENSKVVKSGKGSLLIKTN